ASAKAAECRSTSSAAEKRLEEIAEAGPAKLELDSTAIAAPLIKSAAGLLSLPLWWRLETARPIPIGSKLIVFLPLLRVAQNLVRFVDFLEFFFGGFFVLGHIRVVLARQLAKSTANLVLARRFRHTERLVIISKLNGHLLNVVRLRSSRNSFSSTATKVTKTADLFSATRCFLYPGCANVTGARTGQTHCDHWRGRHTDWSGDVERLRTEMAGPIAWR